MDNRIIPILEKFGLDNKEIKTYIASLKIGLNTVTKIAEETRIDRTSTYHILDKLLQKGMVSYVIKDSKKYFQATSPEKLVESLEERKKELASVMPELLELTKLKKQETIVELYQGKEGLITVLRDVLKEKEDYIVFGEEGRFQEVLPIYIKQLLRDIMLKDKLKERLLSKESMRDQILVTENSEIRYLPDQYFSPVMTVVYKDKVAIFMWTEPYYAIMIKNKDMAQGYRNYFEILWKIAKV